MTMPGRHTILLVDDEPFILKAVARLLAGAGFNTTTCLRCAGLANAVHEVQPDLILLDYNMPGLHGDGICEILKRSGRAPNMKIYLFSAEEESDLVRITAGCGADGYIKKNTPPRELLQRVSEALAGTC